MGKSITYSHNYAGSVTSPYETIYTVKVNQNYVGKDIV